MNLITYDLSILIPNYNNGIYLIQCLNSITNQKTKFKYKIIICDDCSTDNSISILNTFKEKYPEKIKLFLLKKNSGLLHASKLLYSQINTPYFTVLDSDDYWIDNSFIEKGLSFLKNNSEYNIYSCGTKFYYEKTNKFENVNCFNHTSSTLFKGKIDLNILDIMDKIVSNNNKNLKTLLIEQVFEGDFFRFTYFNCFGKNFKNNNDFTGCYRIRDKNCRWNSLDNNIKNFLNIYAEFILYLLLNKQYENNKILINNLDNIKSILNKQEYILYHNYKIRKNEFNIFYNDLIYLLNNSGKYSFKLYIDNLNQTVPIQKNQWYLYRKHFILKENYLIAKNKSFLNDSMEHSSIVNNKISININDKVNFSEINIINSNYFKIIMK